MQSDLNWFVGIVAYNNEKACQEKLERLLAYDDVEFSTYVPVQREMHEWPSTGKRVMVDRIICPSMLFIRCTDAVR
ncbi:MAG: transcriptional regulator, partial [Prevotellaceae bacterium]|nr:transcriptional regulator [Prevotellaceae bacterium]